MRKDYVAREELSPALGRYLETIFYLGAEGEIARPSRIAEWLGLALPTVTAGLRRLTDELHLDWLQADIEAGRLEHAVSDDVAERIYERLNQPTTCPHGNPIPG